MCTYLEGASSPLCFLSDPSDTSDRPWRVFDMDVVVPGKIALETY